MTRPTLHRQRITRSDGKTVQVIQKRGHLSYCVTGCCCGRTERGFAAVPIDTYKREWLGRKLRNVVHLTKGGCLGPCALANVVSLVFDGRSVWFHSVSSEWQVGLIFDYIEAMLTADGYLPPPVDLSEYVFDFYDWEARALTPGDEVAVEPVTQSRLAFLSHADTDLLTLEQARAELPPEFGGVVALNLLNVRDEAQMSRLLDAELGQVEIIVLRLHGSLEGVPGFEALQARARERGQHLVILSGVNDLDPAFARASTVPPDVLETATAYLRAGGVPNLAALCRFLSDRLLLTALEYDPPVQTPAHGLYHPNLPEGAGLSDWAKLARAERASVGVVFYRAHLLSGNTAFVDTLLTALEAQDLNAVGIFTSSLRETQGGLPVALHGLEGNLDVLVSTLAFAVGKVDAGQVTAAGENVAALERLGVPVVQAVVSGMTRGAWEVSTRGLNALGTAMNVALPEFDGRIASVPVSFKARTEGGASVYAPDAERCERLAGLVARLARLRRLENRDKRIAFVLTNSGAKASSVGNAVGLDAPASLLNLLRTMKARGYSVGDLPKSSDVLMFDLLARGSYDDAHPLDETRCFRVPRERYLDWYEAFPEIPKTTLERQWGAPKAHGYVVSQKKEIDVDTEPHSTLEDYLVAGLELTNALIALQPPRGYGMNPDAIYHTPDLPPTHHYAAFYRWLATSQEEGGWGADAIVHVGKHGTLEWLPGKGVGLSQDCFPDLLLGDVPLVYPFIINDPGEGSQAKRRAHGVVVDHLTPPLTQADTYGELAELAQLVNEYYAVEKLDPSKLPALQGRIWKLVQATNLQADLDLKTMLERDHGDHKHTWDDELTEEGVPLTLAEMGGSDVAHLLEDIDGYLCELGLAQIRDGLHVLGEVPPLPDMLRSLTRLENAQGGDTVPSLQEELVRLHGFELTTLLEQKGARLEEERLIQGTLCHTHADVLETLDALAGELFARLETQSYDAARVPAVLEDSNVKPGSSLERTLTFACDTLVPNLEAAHDEVANVLLALDGGYVPAGPAGAPSRGMAHILPTGRNFYAVDPRALPSRSAWEVGQGLARELLARHLAEAATYPEMVALSAWGTSAMRTHGDDVAQVLALLGVRPVWNAHGGRLEGLEPIPLEILGRPRIDVTVRVSGFFRDAFPNLLELLDDAVTLVVGLDEPLDQNYPRAHYLRDLEKARQDPDVPLETAEAHARYRIFGSKPGSYGAGILPLIETQNWRDDGDFARAFLAWGGYAYGRDVAGAEATEVFAERLKTVNVVAHNQDNREHDIFDSDDYFQFMGGMVATVRSLSGQQPKAYFGDSSDPARAQVRDLREEVLRVYRSRVVNPKWLQGIQRHGYKGALELSATVDYIFGFDATAQVAPDFVYEGLAEHYALDANVQDFLRESNPWALQAISERLLEAAQRGMWQAKAKTLESLRQTLLEGDALLEDGLEERV